MRVLECWNRWIPYFGHTGCGAHLLVQPKNHSLLSFLPKKISEHLNLDIKDVIIPGGWHQSQGAGGLEWIHRRNQEGPQQCLLGYHRVNRRQCALQSILWKPRKLILCFQCSSSSSVLCTAWLIHIQTPQVLWETDTETTKNWWGWPSTTEKVKKYSNQRHVYVTCKQKRTQYHALQTSTSFCKIIFKTIKIRVSHSNLADQKCDFKLNNKIYIVLRCIF